MDKYGPERLMQAYKPQTGSLGLLIVDNTALGPGLGGLHLLDKITIEYASQLARRYTFMNSLHGVPFGGGCACLLKGENVKADVREFASAIAPLANNSFVACPGRGAGEEVMELYAYSCGDVRGAAGKPSKLRGIPFEAGGAGLGIANCALAALGFEKIGGAKASVFGLGRDGLFAARVLARNGVKVVAAGELDGATINREGLDVESLAKLVNSGGRVDAFPRGNPATVSQALAEQTDLMLITIPAIDRNLANEIRPRILVEGELGVLGRDEESMLEARGVNVIPDILACGGASLSSHVEYIGGNVVDMTEIVVNSMRRTTMGVLEEPGRSLRERAERIAIARIEEKWKTALKK